jgi:EAL domain-containing protein (putative c-di-GMP-specific phosphodiesterase class I)
VQVAVAELKQSLPELADFKVAFNFFPTSVSGGKIGEMVAAVLEKTPHAGLQFDVEVLEQEYKDSMIKAVADLRAHKFLVSVDDFGTGFSNLGSIKALLPDFLKIDRSFVHDMENVSIRSSLIPEIIGIGRAVGAKLIAEGIENERQYAMLRDLGVEYGQGYFMSRPLPIEGFAAYLRDFA